MLQTFKTSAKPLIQQLYTRRVNSQQQILDLIRFPPLPDDDVLEITHGHLEFEEGILYDGASLSRLADRFLEHFTRYLNGAGHPETEVYSSLIKLDDRMAAKSDTLFRARQFLSLISGTLFLSLSPQPLEVSFHLYWFTD